MNEEITNVVSLFYSQTEKYKGNPLVKYKLDGEYISLSWEEVKEKVLSLAAYLSDNGIKKGDKVALFAFNRYEWWIADMASLSLGAVTVPVYPTNTEDETMYILKNSESKFCFTGNSVQRDIVLNISKKYKKIKGIISLDPQNKKGISISLDKALAEGQKKRKDSFVMKKVSSIKSGDLATLIYTSGTTGEPKGVMITHENVYSDVLQLFDVFDDVVDERETFLSFLPLSHALERVAGYYTPIKIGCSVAFAESFRTIQDDMQTVRPTVIISVPRLYEKMHAGVISESSKFNYIKKSVFDWAMKISKKRIPYVCSMTEPTGFLAKKINFAENKVYSGVKKALGMDRLKVAISGGGPLSISDTDFFLGIGVNLYEGYGLTEASPVTNVNRPGTIKPGTVGPPMCFTEIALSDEGEILVKAPQVMKGYYKMKAETAEAFNSDGYLKTGDIGLIDEDGFLTITGRIKDIIVTAGGKNISPQNIESYLKKSPYIEQIAIIGDRRKFLSCLVVPNFEELKKWAIANGKGLNFSNREEVVNNKHVNDLIEKELLDLTKNFARVEQVKKFKLIKDEWSQATGELTPTLKIKRNVVEEKYSALIESIYEE